MTTLIKKLGSLGAIVAIAGVVAVPLLSAPAGAVSQAQIVEVTVPSSLTLNDAGGGLAAFPEVTLAGGTSDALEAGEQKSAGATLKVFTNNVAGYRLYLTMNSAAEAGNTGATTGAAPAATTTANGSVNQVTADNKLHQNGGSAVLNPITTAGIVGVNEWGAKGGAIEQWTAVPINGTGFTLKETSAPNGPSAPEGDTINDVQFAANTNSATPSGVYSNTVLYTAVAKP